MAQYLIEDTELTAIADKLREKSGKTGEIKGSDFVSEIDNLEKINNSEIIKAIAQDKIQIGDTVYTIDKSPYDLETDWYIAPLNNNVGSATFSPDGKLLILGGEFTGYAKIYSVEGTTITYINDIYADNNDTALSSYVYSVTFSPDGKTLVIGGGFIGRAKIYSVEGTTITYISDIYADNNGAALSSHVGSVVFSPNGNILILGGAFSGKGKVYSVSGTTITYIDNIYADNNSTTLNNNVESAAFSLNGNILILGGRFTGYAKIYSVDGTTITYVSDIYADNNNTALNGYVNPIVFSPDNKTLVLGGRFTGYAKIYNVNGTAITYVSDIYANNGTTALTSYVYSAAFSPNGNILILGGAFSGKGKVYSVSGTTITYISDIYANNSTAQFNSNVESMAFSPDGSTLVLGGYFTDYAKVYNVNDTVIAYVDNIAANNGGIALNNIVESAVFSPDGKLLVLGGNFTGRAKVYSVNGTTIAFVSDIYADNNSTVLNSGVYSAAFSPDGKLLVLSGQFNYGAKVYSVNGTTITYISNIYANNGTSTLYGV